MSILRTMARRLAANSFRFSILLFALVCTVLAVFGSAQAIKNSLERSGIYQTLTGSILKQAVDSGQDVSDGLPLDQPEVTTAAKTAFNPAVLRSSTEQVIDGSYHWLDGKTAKPDFKVDLQPAVTTFKNMTANAAVDHLKSLPACSQQQLRDLVINGAGSANPFQAVCLPPGVNLTAERQKYIDSFTGKNEFLNNPVLTADRLPKTSSGQTLFEQARDAPKAFSWLKLAPWVLGGLAVLSGIAVYYLNNSRRRGVRSLAASFLGNGILLLVIGVMASFLFKYYVNSANSPLHLADGGLQQAVVNIVGTLNQSFCHGLVLFGAAYSLIGVIGLITLRLTRPKMPVEVPLATGGIQSNGQATEPNTESNVAATTLTNGPATSASGGSDANVSPVIPDEPIKNV